VAFTQKQLRITFELTGSSTFSNSTNKLVVEGLRVSASIESSQFPAYPMATIDVFGMLQADMSTLTCFENQLNPIGNSILNVTRNTVIVEANAGGGWTTVFAGQLVSAQPTYMNEPDVALRILARVLYYESFASTPPMSYPGATDVPTMVSSLAARMGAGFENDGVSGISLSCPYYPGSIANQLRAIVEHAHIGLFYDYGPAGQGGPPITIVIAPKGQPRKVPVVNLTPQSGLVSTPTLDSLGWVYARAEWNPGLRFGGTVQIAGSVIPRVNGTWFILSLTHTLESVKPGGSWFSDMHLAGILPYPAPQ
jgi:hypothetical protein